MPETAPLPPPPPAVEAPIIPLGTHVLTVDVMEDGKFIDRMNEALAEAMRASIRSIEPSKVSVTIEIKPKEADEGLRVAVIGKIKTALPPSVDGRVYGLPPGARVVLTDLRSVRKVLKPVEGGGLVNMRTGRPDHGYDDPD